MDTTQLNAVRQQFPDMSQSLILDVFAGHDDAKALEILTSLAAGSPSSSSSSSPSPISQPAEPSADELARQHREQELERKQNVEAAAVLGHVACGGAPRVLTATDMVVLQREGLSGSAARLPSGYIVSGGFANGVADLGCPLLPHASKPSHATVQMLRLHNSTVSFVRRDLTDAPWTTPRVSRAPGYGLYTLPNEPSMPYVIDYRTGESLGKVQLPTGVSFSTCSTAAATTHSLYIAAAQKRQDKYCALYIVVQSVNSEPYAVELKHCADDDFEDLGPAGAFVTDDMQLHLVLTNHWVIVVASSHASADSSVWFVSHSDLKTAYAKNTMADARRVLLSGVSAIADLHADLHDGADGEKVRMFFLSTPHHLHDEPVRANEELRNGSRAVYPSLPSSDQAPVDACPRIVTADFEPRGLRLASIVHNTAALRGTVSGVPFSADQKLVTTSYWLSLGTWPELDTVRTAGVLHIDAPVARRQRAALYSTSHDGGMLQVWEAPTVSWLSGLAQIPASAPGSEQQESWISVNCTRYDDESKSIVEEVLLFHSSDISCGPAFVITLANGSSHSGFHFGCTSTKSIWFDCAE